MIDWTRDERLDEVDRQFRQLGEPCKELDPKGKVDKEVRWKMK